MGFPRQEYWSGLPCEVGAIPHPPRKELSQDGEHNQVGGCLRV